MAYILQSITYTLLMYAVYLLLLRRATAYGWSRFYLLLSACLPPLLPLVRIPGFGNGQGRVAVLTMPAVQVVAGMQHAYGQVAAPVLLSIYAGITVLLLALLAGQYAVCRRFIRRFPCTQLTQTVRMITGCGQGPGSFGRYVFFPGTHIHPAILEHELAHVRHRHSADILFMRLLMCIFWPNVALWAIYRELRAVHEFQADAAASGGSSHYAHTLLNGLFHTRKFSLVHTFFNHPIKRRIIMLQKQQSRSTLRTTIAKSAMAASLIIAGLVYLQGCSRDENLVKPPLAAQTVKSEPATAQTNAVPSVDLQEFMGRNIRYPKSAKERKVEGRVIVRFTIDGQGNLVAPEVKKSPDAEMSAEALRVIAMLPKWTPGTLNGKPVATELCIPVAFRLR